MANNFYNPTGSPTTRAAASSANMRAEFAAIGTAFDKLPALTANAYKITYVNSAGTALAAAQSAYIDASGGLALGTASAGGYKIRVVGTSLSMRLEYEAADASGPRVNMYKGRNGADLQAGDDLGAVNFSAIDSASGSHITARVFADTESAHTPTSKPTRVLITTTPAGTTTAATAVIVDSAQNLTLPNGDLQVTSGRAAFGKALSGNIASVEANNYMGVTGATAGTSPAFYIGRTSLGSDTTLSSCGAAGALFSNTAVGDTVLTTNGAKSLWFGTDQSASSLAALKVDTSGNVALQKDGASFRVKTGGTNATMGRASLVAGVAVVSTTAVTASSNVFLTQQSTGASPGHVRVSARSAGASFTITSDSAADTSSVAWLIYEPS